MILAGIDEAGLGPTLGPLVTASAALSTPDGWRDDSPWERLSEALCDKKRRNDPRLVVADSKVVHKSGGLGEMETTLGVFSLMICGEPRLASARSQSAAAAEAHPCYAGFDTAFPCHADGEAITAAVECMRSALVKNDCGARHLQAAFLFEPSLNMRFAEGLNKNQALLAETGRHLACLVEKFPHDELRIAVDKQGGRNDYLPFLTDLFPGVWIDVLQTGVAASHYRLRRREGDVIIHFQAKADRHSFATALASMAAKYVRERAMTALNTWFCDRMPTLRPTAGYPEDAKRWLADVRRLGDEKSLHLPLITRER